MVIPWGLVLLPACGPAPEAAAPSAPASAPVVVVAVTPLPEPSPPPAGAPAAEAPPPPRSSGAETPAFTATFGVLFRRPGGADPDDFFGGDELLLLREPAACEDARLVAEADRVRVQIRWEQGSSMTFQHFALKDGKATRQGGTIEVVAAPAAVGATGTVRVAPGAQGNLHGGEIDVVVCE